MGESWDKDGKSLLALDYSRVAVVLHTALLGVMSKLDAAIARIEALESRI